MLLERLRRTRFLQKEETVPTKVVAAPTSCPPARYVPVEQCAVVLRECEAADSPEPDAGEDSRTPVAETISLTNGTHLPVRPATESREPVVKLYLHPGRTLIGEMAVDQLCTQFDVAAADRHPDLDSAEYAGGDKSAFLAEVDGPFDGQDHVALLIRSLRP
jgi:hypothetical protein